MPDKRLLGIGFVLCFIYVQIKSTEGVSSKGFAATNLQSLQWRGLIDPCPIEPNNASFEQGHGNNLRLQLHHVYSSCSPIKRPANMSLAEVAQKILASDVARENSYTVYSSGDLLSWVASGETIGTGNYIVRVGFGTPSSGMYVLIDTGSDITWIQCDPCPQCYKQRDALFQPMGSTSYRALPCNSTTCQQLKSFAKVCLNSSCNYRVSYGDSSTTKGDFSLDTLTLTSSDTNLVSVPDFAFGCGHANKGLFSGAAGLLGLGQSSIGFPSQTSSAFGEVFSYCFPSVSSSVPSGFLHFGEAAILDYDVQFTPFVGSRSSSSQYFIKMTNVSVGDDILAISTAIMVDSGTVISRLEQSIYGKLRDTFNQNMPKLQIASPVSPFDTCFQVSSIYEINIPLITLHFQNNVDLHLTPVHVLYPADEGVMCFAFAPSSSGRSVLGNFQQQTYKFVYDIPNARLGISALECN
ncbi:aspartyl protease family protein 2 [Cryptomeria japonica]|uniref:aspartyl protease family protein 2 n=1 Tax=Cryptomeria japonica TaxID=3369 RepID=UPI0027D9EC95|nr:aspartyl protease family protein 2 [Cryptomeria japonica]